ncbi:MAG: cysteine--tRNA ligase [archaeon]|nr:cysteine--tRNA ligase [archaeon]
MGLQGEKTGLHLFNSLDKDNLVEFVPRQGKQVGWYICGPTVYDVSHLGHARNYVSFDIIRRVMEDYFGYNIFFVMNITDIDDKIINRSWQNRLRELRQALGSSQPALRASIEAVLEGPASPASYAELHEELQSNADARRLFDAAGVPCSWSIQAGYLELAARFETEFFEDMEALGVRPPSVVTRVSEYVEEIKSYIEVIIQKGMAYAADGNVYFDTAAFIQQGNFYSKTSLLQSTELLLEGEGALLATEGKKRDQDFALWKASKPGEPVWGSPWGSGRPGWHIECSAMASDLLGSNMDLNCGGTDLRFPHHDNQLAQSEAHYGCKQWVNYFLHTGHLHIDGRKMSKSLKNFISIRQCLKAYSPRQLRLLFLQTHWHNFMEVAVGGSAPDATNSNPADPVAKPDDAATPLAKPADQPPPFILRRAAIVDPNGITTELILANFHQYTSQQTGEFLLPIGVKVVDSLPSSSSSSSSSSTWDLHLEYLIDGKSEERTWPLAEDGTLLELIHLLPGKIRQLEDTVGIERLIADFFLNVDVRLRKAAETGRVPCEKWTPEDREIHAALLQTQMAVHQALLQSIDTPTAMRHLLTLIATTSKRFSNAAGAAFVPSPTVLRSVAIYVEKMFKVFGLMGSEELGPGASIGFTWFPSSPKHVRTAVGSTLTALSKLRDAVRHLARSRGSAADIIAVLDQFSLPRAEPTIHDSLAAVVERFLTTIRAAAGNPQAVLRACDEVRDDWVPVHGVRLEDLPDQPSQWKLDDPAALQHERHLKSVQAAQKKSQAAARLLAQRQKEEAANAKARLPPAELFRVAPEHAGKYAQFDEQGIPTHLADGTPVGKSALKKLQSLFQTQTKVHQAWLKKNPPSH